MSEQELADPNNFVKASIGKNNYEISIKFYKETFEELKLKGLSDKEAKEEVIKKWAEEIGKIPESPAVIYEKYKGISILRR